MKQRSAVRLALAVLLTALLVTPAIGQDKQPLDHAAYEIWREVGQTLLSRDGAWLAYEVTYQNADGELVVRSTLDDTEYTVSRGGGARFTATASHLLALIAPPKQESRRAQLEEIEADRQPKSQLGVLSLADGSLRTFERVRSFRVPEEAGEWVAFLHEVDLPAEDADAQEQVSGEEPAETTGAPAGEAGAAEGETDGVAKALEDREPGTRLVLLNLVTGAEHEIAHVIDYAVAIDGGRLAVATATADGSGDGALLVDPADGSATAILEGTGDYRDLALDRQGHRVAVLSNRDEFGSEQPAFELWASTDGGAAAKVASEAELRSGWWVSEHRAPSFSEGGSRLFFGSAPRPEPKPEPEPMLDEERVRVDIWHWQDPLLQPEQLLEVEQERNRNYLAYVDLEAGRVVQLADETMPQVEVLADGDGDVALGASGLPYRMERSWDSPSRSDHYRVDVRSGDRALVLEGQRGDVRLSPDGRWLVWWDGQDLAWRSRDLGDGDPAALDLTDRVGHAFQDEDHDWPFEPQPYGIAGWTRVSDGARPAGAAEVEVVVYDRYDLWALDPAGVAAPRQITSGAGRDGELRLRHIDLDPDEEWMEADRLLLSGFGEADRDAGFWSVETFGTAPPRELVRAARSFGRPQRAEEADLLVYTRQDVVEFPDLWVASSDFSDARRVSELNPQQSDYNWATAELTEWRSFDGEVLQGLIHKPENFDPSRKYPMMVTFYERNSDGLHEHHAPTPHRSVIRQTFYASRGYVVFTPDITYEIGYPGESALEDVVSGVLHMVAQGYVDEGAIGAQGHSWGGYQIAYMVTKTDLFRAAAGGAPVANMTSAYGGIRWGSGMSRMFQYEKTQSRIGATLWEAPLRYLENSPLFWADKVNTPLMMMHNDHDGAVPWYQGIEMFTALRRLGKPAWLINYNDEPHWPTTYANKVDWNIRMQQFFDHYLKGAPAPVWLAEGIPAARKGKTLGLDLVEQ